MTGKTSPPDPFKKVPDILDGPVAPDDNDPLAEIAALVDGPGASDDGAAAAAANDIASLVADAEILAKPGDQRKREGLSDGEPGWQAKCCRDDRGRVVPNLASVLVPTIADR
jgi:hypothetical protein